MKAQAMLLSYVLSNRRINKLFVTGFPVRKNMGTKAILHQNFLIVLLWWAAIVLKPGCVVAQTNYTLGWNYLGPIYESVAPNYPFYYYKLVQVNANTDRYASIIDVSIQGDANGYQQQGTYRLRVDKYEGTNGRFDGLEIKCTSGNPGAATFYVFNNAVWVRANYSWGWIYYRTVADFSPYTPRSPLVGGSFGQTVSPPTGYMAATSTYGVKCNFDAGVIYYLPFTDVAGNMFVHGDIAIGTVHPRSELSVNGTITAKKIQVLQTGWSDYVFDSSYRLKSIYEIEKYIKANEHLPDIPSAKKIAMDGIDLGEMEKKQMASIEKLTLYIIKEQHEIDSLKVLLRQKQHVP
jgi:hypothetical protein